LPAADVSMPRGGKFSLKIRLPIFFFSEIKKILTMIYGSGVSQLAILVRMKLFFLPKLNNLDCEGAFVNLISSFPMQ